MALLLFLQVDKAIMIYLTQCMKPFIHLIRHNLCESICNLQAAARCRLL